MATIGNVDITSLLFSEQASAPTTPATGKWRLYLKSDGLYVVDDAGTETGPFAASAGSAVFTLPLTPRATWPITATTTMFNAATLAPSDMTVKAFRAHTFVNGTNDGSNYWTITLVKITAANAKTTIGTIATSSDTGSAWTSHISTLNASVAGATYIAFEIVATKTGAPGSLFAGIVVTYS